MGGKHYRTVVVGGVVKMVPYTVTKAEVSGKVDKLRKDGESAPSKVREIIIAGNDKTRQTHILPRTAVNFPLADSLTDYELDGYTGILATKEKEKKYGRKNDTRTPVTIRGFADDLPLGSDWGGEPQQSYGWGWDEPPTRQVG